MKQPSQGLMGCRSRVFFIPQSNPNRHWIRFQSFLELLIEQEKPVDSWRWILDEDRERLDDSGFRFNLNFRGKRGKKKSGFSTKERSDLFPARIPDVPLEVCSYKKPCSHLQQIRGAAEKPEFFCRCAVIRFIYTWKCGLFNALDTSWFSF